MSRMINILMMVSWYLPKDTKEYSANFHYEQALALSKYCNIAVYYPYDKQVKHLTSEMEKGVRVYRSPYKLERKIRNRYYMFRAMKEINREFHPDIIHVQVATEAGRFAIIFGKLFHIPVVLTEHSTIEASGVLHFPLHMYADFTYKNSLFNACVSDDLTEKLSKIFPKYQFTTIYNGIIVPEEVAKDKRYRVEGYVNFVLVANFYDREIKGIPNLLQVVHKLKSDGQKIRLHIIGEGDFRQEFEQITRELDIQDECIFYGKADKKKVYEVIDQMDFLVSASKFESFGCTIAEAMMLGKPVVATKSGGPESFVTENTGILAEKENIDVLYFGIRKMIKHYREYQADEIRKYAIEKFDMENITARYMQVYQEVLEIE